MTAGSSVTLIVRLVGLYGMTFYGILMCMEFLGYTVKKYWMKEMLVSLGITAIIIPILFRYGASTLEKVYPLLVHIPNLLFIVLVLKKNAVQGITAITCSFLMIEPRRWIADSIVILFGCNIMIKYVVEILLIPVFIYMLKKYMVPAIIEINKGSKLQISLLGALSYLSYVYYYVGAYQIFRVYMVQFISVVVPVAAVLFYYILIVVYEKESNKNAVKRNEAELIRQEDEKIRKQLQWLEEESDQERIIRHDRRHNLIIIRGYIEQNRFKESTEYIQKCNH